MNIAAAPEPVYRLMESNADALEAIEVLMATAQHDIMIFDASPQLLRTRDFA